MSTFALALRAQADPQVDPQYQAWMKSMQPPLSAIRSAPDNAALTGSANKLADTFDQVARYWKAKQTPDGVAFAETARDAAKAIAAGNGGLPGLDSRPRGSGGGALSPGAGDRSAG